MERNGAVVVDTHLWIDLFSGKHTPITKALDRLIVLDRANVIGPIFFEVLIGPKREDHRQYILGRLRKFTFLPTKSEVWHHTVKLGVLPGVFLRNVPDSDVLIAAHCEVYDCALFTRDSHFDVFQNLKRFQI